LDSDIQSSVREYSAPEHCETTNRYAKTAYSLSLDLVIATI
jgi:hypothetical protein